jgi:hypothetical protein
MATSASDEPVIHPDLLAILVCPVDKAALRLEATSLVCTLCSRVFPIEDGIPNMLVDEGDERTHVRE